MRITLTAACALTLSVGAISSLTYCATPMGSKSNGLDEHKELGSIEWNRKLEPALLAASTSKKPVMLLFQEIPG